MSLTDFPTTYWKIGEINKFILIIIILSSLIFIPACASNGDFTTNPTALTINTVNGYTETRTFLIINNNPNTNITDLQIVSLDLIRTDNQKIIPASAIKPDSQVTTIPPNGFVQIPVVFNFQNSASGEYPGNLLISSNNSKTMMPVLVKLKDPFLLPLIVLIVSTFLSVIIFDYASKGQNTDKLKIKIHSIEIKLPVEFDQDNQKEFTKYFKGKITNLLNSSKEKLKQGEYDNAKKEYDDAESVWNHWISYSVEWKKRLEESVDISEKLKSINNYKPEPSQFIDSVNEDLQAIWEDTPKAETKPENISNKIEEIETRVVLFEQTYKDINEAIESVPASTEIRKCFEKLQQDLLLLDFRQNDQRKNFFASYETKMKECLTKETQEQRSSDNTLILLQRISPIMSAFNAMNAEDVKRRPTPDAAAKKDAIKRKSLWAKVSLYFKASLWASIWLYVFDKFHSIIIPAVILIFIGYSQLYQSNATFGVNGIGDYSTLLFWGFGTGPASDTIVQLVKDKTK